jgi:two-component system, chemotaxis family, protein-glutamate methylesterase/glutaminase
VSGTVGVSCASGPRPRARFPVAVGIGASAGGPRALMTLLASLELPASAYAFLVQHIHPKFTHILCRRLAEVARMPVLAAEQGAEAQPGRLYVAPSGHHLELERRQPCTFRLRLTDGPPRHGVRPAVDELFVSLARVFGSRTIGVVLTGMGRDGLEGARAIKAQGGTVFAEAESTCVVYGMPRALAEAGLADRLLPLGEMAAAIQETATTTADLGSAGFARGQG